jgi:hypothetical protein
MIKNLLTAAVAAGFTAFDLWDEEGKIARVTSVSEAMTYINNLDGVSIEFLQPNGNGGFNIKDFLYYVGENEGEECFADFGAGGWVEDYLRP